MVWACRDTHYNEIAYTRMGKERSKYINPINSLNKRGTTLAFEASVMLTVFEGGSVR